MLSVLSLIQDLLPTGLRGPFRLDCYNLVGNFIAGFSLKKEHLVPENAS